MTTFGLAAPVDLWTATGLQGNARPRLAATRPRLATARSSVCAAPAPHGEDRRDLRYRIFLRDLTTPQAMANSGVLSMAAGVQKNGATSCPCAAREGGLYGRAAVDLTTARAMKASPPAASSVLSPVADVQGVSSYPHLPAASSMHLRSRSRSSTLCCVKKRPSSSETPQHSSLCAMAGRAAVDLTIARAMKASPPAAFSVLSPVADVQGVSSYPHLPAASSMHLRSRSRSSTLCCVKKRPSSSETPQHSNLCAMAGRAAVDLTTARAMKVSPPAASSVLSPVADVQGVSSYPHLPAASSMHLRSRSRSSTLCCVKKRPSSSETPQHSNPCAMAVNISRRLAKELTRLTNIIMKFVVRMMKRPEMKKLKSILLWTIFDASNAVLLATTPSAIEPSPEVKKPSSVWSMVAESERKWARKLALKTKSMVIFKVYAQLLMRVMRVIIVTFICVLSIFIYIAIKERRIIGHIGVQLLVKCKMLVVLCYKAIQVYNLSEKSMKAYTFILDKRMLLMVECKKVEKAYRLSEKAKLIYAKVKAYNFTEKIEEAGSLAEKTTITLGKMKKVYIIFKKLIKYFF